MKSLWKKLSIGMASFAMVVGIGFTSKNVTTAKAAAGDTLTEASGTGSGYGARRTLTNNGVGWVLSTGQSGFLGTNKAENHTKVTPTAADLPVVQAVNASASTTTTGLYFYYTTTALANVGALQFSYTANSGNSSAKGYVVVGSELSASGGAAYTQVSLASDSASKQGDSLGSSGTFTWTFASTYSEAMYYGFVIEASTYKRMTNGKIALLEGASHVAVEALNVTQTSFSLTKGETAQIVASVEPADATEQGITYTVDAGYEEFISVSSTGLITALNGVENATITVKTVEGNFEQKVTVSVSVPTAEETIALINAIGTVEYTDACKARIDAARSSYNNLDTALQGTVTNYDVLVAAENEYARLEAAAIEAADRAKAAEVDTLIDAIGEITDYSKKEQIVAAREAYEALTEVQKGYVTKLATLEAAEATIEDYKPLSYFINTTAGGAENASTAISTAAELEKVYPTPEGISWVSGTKAYGSSTQILKFGSSSAVGLAKLQLDSNDYYVTTVVINAKRYSSDAATLYVNSENAVSLTATATDYEFDISASETQSIEFGTKAKRAYVYSVTVYYAKFDAVIDQEAVDNVIAKINAIGTVAPTLDVMHAIEEAEAAYDVLLTAEKELVTNYKTLTDARTAFDALVTKADKMEGISTGYGAATVTIGTATFDVNVAGNNSSIGFNANAKSTAVASEPIANAIDGIDTTTTGVVTMHSFFYDGFVSYHFTTGDSFTGTFYLLTSADGGKTYTILSQMALDTSSVKDISVETAITTTTDIAMVFVLDSASVARISLVSTTFYDHLEYSSDLSTLLEMLSELNTCTDYDQAAAFSELLAELPERDQVLFSRATIEDLDSEANIVLVNAADKLSFMSNLAAQKANGQAQASRNLMTRLGQRSSMIAILVIGGIGLLSILGYYFVSKKRFSR